MSTIFESFKCRIFASSLAILILSSCGANDECISADDFGAYEYSFKTTVNALNPSFVTSDDTLSTAVSSSTSTTTTTVSSLSPGITENDAYVNAWTKVKLKTSDTTVLNNEDKNGFVAKKDVPIIINISDGAANLVSTFEVMNLVVDSNAKETGFAGINSTRNKYAPGSVISVAISGSAQDINGEKISLQDAIAFHIESDELDSTVSDYTDTSAWLCNIGSKQFFSSRIDTGSGDYICDFISGQDCAAVGIADRVSDANYKIFGNGYKISGDDRIARSENLDHELFDVNSGFAICTSDSDNKYAKSTTEYIGWSDSDWPYENAMTGTYFGGRSCSAIATQNNMSVVAQKVGGLVKYSSVSGMNRADWADGKNYIIDSKYPNIKNPYRSDSPNATLTTCSQPAFTTTNTKQIFLFKSLSNDPQAHRGFHHNRYAIETNLRAGTGWKAYFPYCGLEPNRIQDQESHAMKLMASFISRPKVGNAIMRAYSQSKWECGSDTDCQYDEISTSSSSGDADDYLSGFVDGDSSYSSTSSFGGDGACWAGSYANSCAGSVQVAGFLTYRDSTWWTDLRIANSDWMSFAEAGNGFTLLPQLGEAKPECTVSISGSSTKAYVDMSNGMSWTVLPVPFSKGQSVSISTSPRLQYDESSGVSLHVAKNREIQSFGFQESVPTNFTDRISISDSFKNEMYGSSGKKEREDHWMLDPVISSGGKLANYGWCYERSPCKVGSKFCESYSYIDNDGNDATYDGVEDAKFLFSAWRYNEDNGNARYAHLKCNSSSHDDVMTSKMKTKEYLAYKDQALLHAKTSSTANCGYNGDRDATTTNYSAIYCNSSSKWFPYEYRSIANHCNIWDDCYTTGGVLDFWLTGKAFESNIRTPSLSSHNLYCHPNKTRECGIAMGFRTFKGEIHRCKAGYNANCSDTRYNGSQCGIYPRPTAKELASDSDSKYTRILGVCTRKVTAVSGTSTTSKEFIMAYNTLDNAASSKSVTSPSLRNLIQYGEFTQLSTDRSQSLSVAGGSSYQTTELVAQKNCGVCVADKNAFVNGILKDANLIKTAKSMLDCSTGWVTSYTVNGSDRKLITINDANTSAYTSIPQGDTIKVSYSFSPVSAVNECQDSLAGFGYYDQNLTETTQSLALFKSMSLLKSDNDSITNNSVSGRLSSVGSVIKVPTGLGRSTIHAYFVGEGGSTNSVKSNGYWGFDRFKLKSNAQIQFSSGTSTSDGSGLFFYIQPILDTGVPDPDQHPKVKFPTKQSLEDARAAGNSALFSFSVYRTASDKAIIYPTSTGILWAIIFDRKPTSSQYDRDGKYIIFDVSDSVDPFSTEYENQTVALDGSNVLGYNSGGYIIQAKQAIDSTTDGFTTSLLDNIGTWSSSTASGTTVLIGGSLLEQFQAMIYGSLDPDSKVCKTYLSTADGLLDITSTTSTTTTVSTGSSVGEDTGCGTYSVNGSNISANATTISIEGSALTSSSVAAKYRYFCRYVKSLKGGNVCAYSGSATVSATSSLSKCSTLKTSLNLGSVGTQNNTSILTPSSLTISDDFVNRSVPIYTSTASGCTLYNSPSDNPNSGWSHWSTCSYPNQINITRINLARIDANFLGVYKNSSEITKSTSNLASISNLNTAYSLLQGGLGAQAIKNASNPVSIKMFSEFAIDSGDDIRVCFNQPTITTYSGTYSRSGSSHTIDSSDQTTENLAGSYTLGYYVRNILNKSSSRALTCSNQTVTLSDGTALTMSSDTAITGNASADYSNGLISSLWCTDSSCSDYTQSVKDKFYISNIYHCGLVKCDSNYENCNITTCSDSDTSCNPLENALTTIDNPALPEKYGKCETPVSSKTVCYIYKINPNISTPANIRYCMYANVSTGSVSEGGVTYMCWVSKNTSTVVNSDIYGVDDYSNQTYLESPQPFKEFSSCSYDSSSTMTCTMTNRKYDVVSGEVVLRSSSSSSVTAARSNFSAVGEDLNGVTTRLSLLATDSSKCTTTTSTINKANCTKTATGYDCVIDSSTVEVTEDEYYSGTKTTSVCTVYSVCTDPTYTGSSESNSTTSSVSSSSSTSSSTTTTKTVCTYGERNFKTGFIYQLFHAITSSVAYQAAFYTLVIFWFMKYGYEMVQGELKMSPKVLFDHGVRFGISVGLCSPNGWDMYQSLIVSGAMKISENFNSLAMSSVTGGAESVTVAMIFSPISELLSMLLSTNFWLKILAAAFSLPYLTGVLISMMMIGAVLNIMGMLFTVVTQYLSSVIMLGLYLSMGPLVALGYMYDGYKSHFENWKKEIIGCIAEQFFLVLSMSVSSQVLIYLLKPLIYRKICYQPVLSLPIGDLIKEVTGVEIDALNIPLISFWKYDNSSELSNMLATITSASTDSLVSSSGAPSFSIILIIMIIPNSINQVIGIMSSLSSGIGGGKTKDIFGDLVNKGKAAASFIARDVAIGTIDKGIEKATGRKNYIGSKYDKTSKAISSAYGKLTNTDILGKMDLLGSKAAGQALGVTQKLVANQRNIDKRISNAKDTMAAGAAALKAQASIADAITGSGILNEISKAKKNLKEKIKESKNFDKETSKLEKEYKDEKTTQDRKIQIKNDLIRINDGKKKAQADIDSLSSNIDGLNKKREDIRSKAKEDARKNTRKDVVDKMLEKESSIDKNKATSKIKNALKKTGLVEENLIQSEMKTNGVSLGKGAYNKVRDIIANGSDVNAMTDSDIDSMIDFSEKEMKDPEGMASKRQSFKKAVSDISSRVEKATEKANSTL